MNTLIALTIPFSFVTMMLGAGGVYASRYAGTSAATGLASGITLVLSGIALLASLGLSGGTP